MKIGRRWRVSSGFTLIELMVVVVIIGVLAAIALPLYSGFLSRTRRSEAVYNLEGIFKAEIAYFSERQDFAPEFSTIHWTPEGTARYTYSVGGVSAGAALAVNPMPAGLSPGAGATSFTACAWGNVDNDPVVDALSIGETNNLVKVIDDLRT